MKQTAGGSVILSAVAHGGACHPETMKIVTRSVSEGLPDFRSSEESGVGRASGKILRCAQDDDGHQTPFIAHRFSACFSAKIMAI